MWMSVNSAAIDSHLAWHDVCTVQSHLGPRLLDNDEWASVSLPLVPSSVSIVEALPKFSSKNHDTTCICIIVTWTTGAQSAWYPTHCQSKPVVQISKNRECLETAFQHVVFMPLTSCFSQQAALKQWWQIQTRFMPVRIQLLYAFAHLIKLGCQHNHSNLCMANSPQNYTKCFC